AADADSRVHAAGKENVCQHGGGGRLAVGSGNGDGAGVVVHDLSEKSGAGHHRDALCFCGGKLFVVFVDGSGVHNKVDVIGDVLRPLSDGDAGADAGEMSRDIGGLHVRAGDRKMAVDENLREAAHADAADADKVDVDWFLEVYFIHFLYLCFYIN